MTGIDVVALLPLEVAALTSVAAILAIAIRRSHLATALTTGIGLAVAIGVIAPAARLTPHLATPLLVVDDFALVFDAIILVAALAVVLLAYGYLGRRQAQREELYVLVATATLGAMVLAHAEHFATLFLGLETLSVSLFALVSYLGRSPGAIEAGVKYLVLAGLSSALFLFGLALVYSETGTMRLGGLAGSLGGISLTSPLALAGAALVLVGFGFKLALVPFHLWTPDVYQGASSPVTAFVATVSKAGAVAALARFVTSLGEPRGSPVITALAAIAVASMIAGNLLALRQTNVKRLLAYSSISHLGYILVALLAGGRAATEAVTFYVAAYVATLMGAFGTIAALSTSEGEPEQLDDLRGLFWSRPGAAATLTACMLSLAGIPLTAGFVAKFYVLAAGIDAGLWAAVIILVLTSAVGLYYYLRVIVAMLSAPPAEPHAERRLAIPLGAGIVLALAFLSLVWLGVYPSTLAVFARAAGS